MIKPEWAEPDWAGPSASGDARVGQMNGINTGDSAFHFGDTTYNINQDDPPERKEKVALHHLRAGMPRAAEGLLGDLLRGGHGSSKRAYYYALSLFSGRPFIDVKPALIEELEGASGIAAESPRDGWRDALDAACVLLQHACGAVPEGGASGFAAAQAKLDDLPDDRRSEINRHLDAVLDGATREYLQRSEAERVATERMQPNRQDRSWKFFEAEPVSPQPWLPSATPIDPEVRKNTSYGALFTVAGVVCLYPFLGGVGVWGGMALLAGGAWLVAEHGIAIATAEAVRQRDEQDADPDVPEEAPASPGHWVSTSFAEKLHEHVRSAFSGARRHVSGSWMAETRGVRRTLTRRLAEVYGNRRVEPEQLDWLMRWHAERCAERWVRGEPLAGSTPSPPNKSVFLKYCGFTIGLLGLVALLGAGAAWPAILIGAGGVAFAEYGTSMAASRRADVRRTQEAEQLHEDERRAYDEWLQVLADRPTDPEIGLWLSLDKQFLLWAAQSSAGLASREVLEHAMTIERMPKAREAMVPHGVPRYTHYLAKVFLLTKSGIRFVEFGYDFLTGARHNESTRNFSYRTLGSVHVSETGVRALDAMRYAVDDSARPLISEVVRLRRRVLHLNLLDGTTITVIVNRFNGLRDISAAEDRQARAREIGSEGVEATLHILEFVTAEGPEWLEREHERRERLRRSWRNADSGGLFV